jgi:hypothetical protein
LLRDAGNLAAALGDQEPCEVVLLGSIASSKYVELLDDVLERRLRFPAEFVGRGDMSRGGLLRQADQGRELAYDSENPGADKMRGGGLEPTAALRPSDSRTQRNFKQFQHFGCSERAVA